MPKILPTERAMGWVTAFSGLAIPVGILLGAGPLGGQSLALKIFERVMWGINPFGMAVFSTPALSGSFWGIIGFYILGTLLSALMWGMIDAFWKRWKKSR